MWNNHTVVHNLRLRAAEPWWRHQMETFSALLAICAGNSPVPGEFPTQRPVTRSFDVSFDLRLNKQLSKQWWGWWFETLSCLLWRHRNGCPRPHNFINMIIHWGLEMDISVSETDQHWFRLWFVTILFDAEPWPKPTTDDYQLDP